MYVGIDIVHDFLFFSVASDLIGSAVVSFDISLSVVGSPFILVPAITSALGRHSYCKHM